MTNPAKTTGAASKTTAAAPAVATAVPKERVMSYDVFRGILLIGMVVFHVLVNLTPLQFNQKLFYWVPLGFVLFLGVILARFLRNKNNKKIKLALKLMAIFLIFNLPVLMSQNFSLSDLVQGDQKIFSFEILLPMAAVILLTVPIEKIKKKKLDDSRYETKVALIIAISIFAVLVALDLTGIYFYNLNFTLYGLLGYYAAMQTDLNTLPARKKYLPFAVLIATAPFFLPYSPDYVTMIQVFAMYLLTGALIGKNTPLALLGRYSLFLYVAHIIAIKGFQLLFMR